MLCWSFSPYIHLSHHCPLLEYFPQCPQSASMSHICHHLTFPTLLLRTFSVSHDMLSFQDLQALLYIYIYQKSKSRIYTLKKIWNTLWIGLTSFDIITFIHFLANSWFHLSLWLKKITFCICIVFFHLFINGYLGQFYFPSGWQWQQWTEMQVSHGRTQSPLGLC